MAGRGETWVSSKAESRHDRHYRRAQKQVFDPGRLVCKAQACVQGAGLHERETGRNGEWVTDAPNQR